MKEVVDLTRSKRPIKVPDEKDIENIGHVRLRAVEELNDIETAITRLESPEYKELVEESKQDMIEIALAAMELEPDDVKAFSRAQGQFFERKRLTRKLANVRIEAESKQSFIRNMDNRLRQMVKMMRKTKEGKKDGR